MAQRYGNPNASGYSITSLGGPTPSSIEQQQQQNLYGTANAIAPGGDPQQQLTSLNFFSGTQQSQQAAVAAATAAAAAVSAGYPATPAALMGPLMGAASDSETEQLKQQKELIYAHPLFPLLTVLFQKCELATCTPREPPNEGDQVDLMNVCSAASFSEDLAEFAKTVQMNKPFYMPNPELDSLMLNAIQVLRYHLLELEKVHELCDNFCNKYVNKIKDRTQKEMNCEPPPPAQMPPLPGGHKSEHPQRQQSMTPRTAQQQMAAALKSSPGVATTSAAAIVMEQQQQQQLQPQLFGMAGQYDQQQLEALQSQQQQQPCSSLLPSQQQQHEQLGFLNTNGGGGGSQLLVGGGMDGGGNNGIGARLEQQQQQFYAIQQQQQQQEMMRAGGGKSAKRSHTSNKSKRKHHPFESHPSPDTTARTDSAGGSRSSTAAVTVAGDELQHLQQQQGNRHSNNNSLCMDGLDEMGGEDGDLSNCGEDSMMGDSGGSESEQKPGGGSGRGGRGGQNSKKKVPKVFSKEAINTFRAWLFNNIAHPYPAEEQKKQLAAETGLTILQVNNWFINARRRIVQPMIDSNNRAGHPVSVFKNRRHKSSGGAGGGVAGSPSPAPEGSSPDNILSNGTTNVNGTVVGVGGVGLALSTSPEEMATNNSGGSSSSANTLIGGNAANVVAGGGGIVGQPLLPFAASIPATAALPNPYQAAAAVAAATAIGNPYGFGGAFPFAGMGGMSAAAAMMPAYGLNSMAAAGGWAGAMDLSGAQAHRAE